MMKKCNQMRILVHDIKVVHCVQLEGFQYGSVTGLLPQVHHIILNSVRQHNYFITQGNYIGYMFRL